MPQRPGLGHGPPSAGGLGRRQGGRLADGGAHGDDLYRGPDDLEGLADPRDRLGLCLERLERSARDGHLERHADAPEDRIVRDRLIARGVMRVAKIEGLIRDHGDSDPAGHPSANRSTQIFGDEITAQWQAVREAAHGVQGRNIVQELKSSWRLSANSSTVSSGATWHRYDPPRCGSALRWTSRR